jgi:cysteine desulfurase family protein (TIGR01976 family)
MDSTQSEQTRSRFPALKQDQVYLDNAGGSQTLDAVITSITDYLTNNNVQLGASYHVSQTSTSRFNKAFQAGARYINANQDEVVFGSSTTQLFRNLSYVLNFEPGDEIIVSAIDHEANIAPWVALAKRQKLELKWWRPSRSEDPNLYASDLYGLLSRRTKLVTCTHASNILGYVNDIKSITAAAHSVGALVCVDGVAYAPHRPIDVDELGVDFYAFSWYKVFGPHIAMLYASWRAQQQLGSLGHFFNPQASLDDKLGMSGASYELAQAVPEVVEYLCPAGVGSKFKDIMQHEWELHSILVKTLREFQNVRIYGLGDNSPATRLSTVSFTVDGWDSKALVLAVEAESNYGIRWGSFYSERLVRDVLGLGPGGVVRVSMVHYNSIEEMQGLCSLLAKLIGQSSRQKV